MKRREVLFLLISIFVMVLAWIGFSIYHNLLTSTIPEALGIRITPISPNVDTKTLDALKKREKVSPLFTAGTAPSVSPTQPASESAVPTITPVLSPTNQASPGGTTP
jgi:hypothetical protein